MVLNQDELYLYDDEAASKHKKLIILSGCYIIELPHVEVCHHEAQKYYPLVIQIYGYKNKVG